MVGRINWWSIRSSRVQGRDFICLGGPDSPMMARKWFKSEEKSVFSIILMVPGALFTLWAPQSIWKSYTMRDWLLLANVL